jgi:hypothetical protein
METCYFCPRLTDLSVEIEQKSWVRGAEYRIHVVRLRTTVSVCATCLETMFHDTMEKLNDVIRREQPKAEKTERITDFQWSDDDE